MKLTKRNSPNYRPSEKKEIVLFNFGRVDWGEFLIKSLLTAGVLTLSILMISIAWEGAEWILKDKPQSEINRELEEKRKFEAMCEKLGKWADTGSVRSSWMCK